MMLRGGYTWNNPYFGEKYDFSVSGLFCGLKTLMKHIQYKKSRKSDNNLFLGGGKYPLYLTIFFYIRGVSPKFENVIQRTPSHDLLL